MAKYTPETMSTGTKVSYKPDRDAGGGSVEEPIIARCSVRN